MNDAPTETRCCTTPNAPVFSFRHYMMAHAPAVPQDWFKPKLRLPPETQWSVDGKFVTNGTEIGEWELERARARFIQWPAAWADSVIADLAKKETK